MVKPKVAKPNGLSTKRFILKLSRNIFFGFIIISISLLLGMLGYRHFEHMNWIDAYLNSAMLLSGMGQVSELKTDGGKIFAASYALFSGIIFLVTIAIIFAPLIHHFFHKFHLEESKIN